MPRQRGVRVVGGGQSGSNEPLQPTGAAIPASREVQALRAAPAAELGRSGGARRSDRPKLACRKMILDGEHRSDWRCLEIRASSSAESTQLNWRSAVAFSLRALTITTPCARAPGVMLNRGTSRSASPLVELGHWLINKRGPEVVDVVVSRR